MAVLTTYGTVRSGSQRIAVRLEVDPDNLDSVKVLSDTPVGGAPEIELSCDGTLTLRQLLTVARALERMGWRVT